MLSAAASGLTPARDARDRVGRPSGSTDVRDASTSSILAASSSEATRSSVPGAAASSSIRAQAPKGSRLTAELKSGWLELVSEGSER